MAVSSRSYAIQRGAASASSLCEAIAGGALSAAQVVEGFLERCADAELSVRAWAHLDPSQARRQARNADASLRRRQGPSGRLHGLPVGIKDIFDTADMPTELGTVLHAGRRPAKDAAAVERLRAAGAVILGKTVTTEFATYAPGKTRNPHRLTHTPGGSSSGSAAAVAAGMVPAALGTQTNGSVIRPAAFCGVVGYKPSFGLISRRGMLRVSDSFDHVGVFAASVEDAALVAGVLVGKDEFDPATESMPQGFVLPALARLRTAPRFAFVRTPMWPRTTRATRALFGAIGRALRGGWDEVRLGQAAGAYDAHQCIMEAEMALNLEAEWDSRAHLSASLRHQLERGRKYSAVAYRRAVARAELLRREVAELFERYDAIVTPSAPGPAPRGLDSTGDPSFCTLWTLLGLPAISLPLGRSALGLPLAVQLVGPKYADAQLLSVADWFSRRMKAGA